MILTNLGEESLNGEEVAELRINEAQSTFLQTEIV